MKKQNVIREKKLDKKILILDIETSVLTANVFRPGDQRISHKQLITDFYILSFASKWLYDKKVEYMACKPKSTDDTALLKKLHELISEADAIVTHNGINFDLKKIKTRMIVEGFSPLPKVKMIDTLRIARKEFSFTSNALANLSESLCTMKKSSHSKFPGMELWKEFQRGNPEARKEMRLYNIQDVLATEELYLKFRGWNSNHPSMTVLDDEVVLRCPVCESYAIRKNGYYTTNKSKFQRYSCGSCGSWSSSSTSLNTKSKRDTILLTR